MISEHKIKIEDKIDGFVKQARETAAANDV